MKSEAKSESRNPHWLYFDEPSLTKQEFKDECDINLIIERARLGADIAHLNSRVAQYGDVSSIPDYRSALDVVNRANGMFMSLDARVRERFANDPAKFLAFCQDPRNYEEAVGLGLVQRKTEPVGTPPTTAGVPVSEDAPGAESEESSEGPAPSPKGKPAPSVSGRKAGSHR